MEVNLTTITGNTYPVKDQLRALGGKWNPDAKGWDVPDNQADKAKQLVATAPAPAKRQFTRADGIALAAWKRGETPGICYSCGAKCKYPYTECWDCKQEREMGY